MDALITARGLAKAYPTPAGPLPVLTDLDLDVAPGEMVAVVGASGVGKSTLLHVLGTLDRPDGGSLRIAGEDVLALSEPRRCEFRNRTLGFVFQFHHLLREFSALENVMMPLRIAGEEPGPARARAAELLASVGLGERMTHRPAALSGGEQQRCAVARALVHRPAVVLADEPTGNLDHGNGELVADVLFRLVREREAAVLLVTHNRRLAGRADRVLLLRDGRLEPVPAAEALP